MTKFAEIRTDLALENREMLDSPQIDGVEIDVYESDGATVTWVRVLNESGAEALNKPIGNYVTIESEAMKQNDKAAHENIIKIVADVLEDLYKNLLQLSEDSTILAAGLGNWQVTPDALGPKVIDRLLVTRHIEDIYPDRLNLRSVAAIAPGVMGITGIETGEIIKGISEKIGPNLIIAIDALAARRTSRINSTIQMTDTGISPGAGLGNHRQPLNKETLGIPVIAIGVPTVVDAATMVNDTMNQILEQMITAAPKGTEFYDMLISLSEEEKYGLIKELSGNLFVTPKEVDAVIENLAGIIAKGMNAALHPGVDISTGYSL